MLWQVRCRENGKDCQRSFSRACLHCVVWEENWRFNPGRWIYWCGHHRTWLWHPYVDQKWHHCGKGCHFDDWSRSGTEVCPRSDTGCQRHTHCQGLHFNFPCGDIQDKSCFQAWKCYFRLRCLLRGSYYVIMLVLVEQGTPDRRIKFTKDPGTGSALPKWPSDIRLVDERTVTRGRLQILYRGKWRGVCANFQK